MSQGFSSVSSFKKGGAFVVSLDVTKVGGEEGVGHLGLLLVGRALLSPGSLKTPQREATS